MKFNGGRPLRQSPIRNPLPGCSSVIVLYVGQLTALQGNYLRQPIAYSLAGQKPFGKRRRQTFLLSRRADRIDSAEAPDRSLDRPVYEECLRRREKADTEEATGSRVNLRKSKHFSGRRGAPGWPRSRQRFRRAEVVRDAGGDVGAASQEMRALSRAPPGPRGGGGRMLFDWDGGSGGYRTYLVARGGCCTVACRWSCAFRGQRRNKLEFCFGSRSNRGSWAPESTREWVQSRTPSDERALPSNRTTTSRKPANFRTVRNVPSTLFKVDVDDTAESLRPDQRFPIR